jgi:hypothetical protein
MNSTTKYQVWITTEALGTTRYGNKSSREHADRKAEQARSQMIWVGGETRYERATKVEIKEA